MKIKIAEKNYDEVMALLEKKKNIKPIKPSILFRTLLKVVSMPELVATGFKCNKIGMERLGKKEPCLILMNHSSFIDMKIAASVLYPRPFNIICTTDGFVGKNFLMHQLGCIPTNKFVPDFGLVKKMKYSLTKLKSSVLMYPEAGYSFDGTATVLPDNIGKLIKLLGVPVVMIRTYGAFSRDPLYNNLQKRKVKVSADMEYLLSPDEIKERTPDELQAIAEMKFRFDNFRWQQESGIIIKEKFRADCLNRVLYKCPDCLAEGQMQGSGIRIKCNACGCEHELSEDGFLRSVIGEVSALKRKLKREDIPLILTLIFICSSTPNAFIRSVTEDWYIIMRDLPLRGATVRFPISRSRWLPTRLIPISSGMRLVT